ncbi:hypothetical protein DL95DRAFT_106915 [Leptodontidium sp. 2 PMI_412]|nr:hypothetical protein DL95DRAFT_106915 [Leptodontidium sp. 2 PMI_412]
MCLGQISTSEIYRLTQRLKVWALHLVEYGWESLVVNIYSTSRFIIGHSFTIMPLYSSITQLPQQPKECESSMPFPSPPLRLPSNDAKPLYSQPPPSNLTTRKISRTPRYSQPENHAPYIRPGSREKPAEV